MTEVCLNLTFSKTLFIDSCCRISKSVSHHCDHGFKCLLRSVISTDMPKSVVKFRFASVFTFLARNEDRRYIFLHWEDIYRLNEFNVVVDLVVNDTHMTVVLNLNSRSFKKLISWKVNSSKCLLY